MHAVAQQHALSAFGTIVGHFSSNAASIMACHMKIGITPCFVQASIISSVGSRIAAMAARALLMQTSQPYRGQGSTSPCNARATRSTMFIYHPPTLAVLGAPNRPHCHQKLRDSSPESRK